MELIGRVQGNTPGGVAEQATGSPDGRRAWQIHCRDVVNRERSLTVVVDKGRVVLMGPPGETAVLSAGQLGQLRTVLREAADQAER
ncbi:hypothetical protein [Kutzneria buriramensis]|uniref:Uncharacterized protein n=1 Tax=Kutzneria buriramensis TaxID=1045776 RepID=A0A3E0HU29_9PSEU|nr:hypothetical protein [Kutzneria buriramensis]REH49919.1 hypothetical protein BCF44_104185 [Kutzneria buriramensis]